MAPYYKICRRENLGKYQCLSSPESEFDFERTTNNESSTCSEGTPISSDDPTQPVQSQKHLQIQCQCQCHEYSPSLDSLERSLLYVLIMKHHLLAVKLCDEIKKTSSHENSIHKPPQSEERPAIDVCANSNQGIQLLKHQSNMRPGLDNQCVEQTADPQNFGETEATVKEKQFYSCKFCQKMFRKKWHASEHLRIHTGEKPFPCPVCGKYFRTKSQVKQHGSVPCSKSRPNK